MRSTACNSFENVDSSQGCDFADDMNEEVAETIRRISKSTPQALIRGFKLQT
jgi:hypothetical protein